MLLRTSVFQSMDLYGTQHVQPSSLQPQPVVGQLWHLFYVIALLLSAAVCSAARRTTGRGRACPARCACWNFAEETGTSLC